MEILLQKEKELIESREARMEERDRDFRRMRDQQLSEIEMEKRSVIQEREWLESVRQDLDCQFDTGKKKSQNHRSSSR